MKLNRFGFLQRRKGDNVKIFDKVNWLSDTNYKRSKAIILWKLKHNYFIMYL